MVLLQLWIYFFCQSTASLQHLYIEIVQPFNIMNTFQTIDQPAVLSQKAVTDILASKQLQPFGFAEHKLESPPHNSNLVSLPHLQIVQW